MSNYVTSNLIQVTPEPNRLAIRVDDKVFLAARPGDADVSDTTATAADVLSGKVFRNSAGAITSGGIQIQGGQTITPSTSDQYILSGLYLGGDQIIKGDSALVASNIVSGASIFGVSGNAQTGTDVSDTTALAGDVLSGKVFYTSGGVKTSGTIPTNPGATITPSTSSQTISAGQYLSGGIIIQGDANLIGTNIVSGASIFGVTGTAAAGGAFDLVKVTGYTQAKDAYSAVTQIVVSGLTNEEEWGMDFSAFNGTYTPTADTAEETDPLKRIYKHSTENKWIKHYVWDPEESGEGTGYWLMVTNLNSGMWDAALSKTSNNQPLASGTANWENMDYGMTQSATLAVTTTDFPAVAFSLTGKQITGYTDTSNIRKYAEASSSSNLTAADDMPVVGNMAVISNNRLIINTPRETLVQSLPASKLIFYDPLSKDTDKAYTGQPITKNKKGSTGFTYQTYKGIPCVRLYDESNMKVTSGIDGIPTGASPFTMSVWCCLLVRPDDDYGVVPLGFGKDGENTLTCLWFSGGLEGNDNNISTLVRVYYGLYSGTQYVLDTWYHIATTYDGTTLRYYVNGVAGNYDNSPTVALQKEAIYIGCLNNNQYNPWNGYIAAPRIYATALSAQEVAVLASEFTPTA